MKILCPHCGVTGSADDSYCDRKVKCPKCETIFLVQAEMDLGQDAVLQSGFVESIEPETPIEDDIEQEVEDNIVEELDLSALSAEIDQQLQENEKEEFVSSRDSEDTLGLAEDEIDVASPEEAGQAASMVETAETAEREETLGADIIEEAVTVVAARDGKIEQEAYGLTRELCWQCGKEDNVGEPFIAKDGRLYCTDCVPDEIEIDEEPAPELSGNINTPYYNFSVIELLKEAWAKTKGAKGALWGASAIMYLVIIVMVAGGALFFPTDTVEMSGSMKMFIAGLVEQLIISIVSVLFTAGLLYMGIRAVVGDPISWKMIGKGFSVAGNLIIATILQSVFISIGLLLLILPGIYLIIGYTMTLPLIVDQGMSPWQAMEKSRKTIHKIWWKVFGLFLLMSLICLVSSVPLGIGLIWTWPMFIILAGVLYCYLFGTTKVDE